MNYRDVPIICPNCGSKDVEQTTIGGIVNKPDTVNRATCCKCLHVGKVCDFYPAEVRAVMNRSRLTELEALLAKATPGEWRSNGAYVQAPRTGDVCACNWKNDRPAVANADLIAALRNIAPKLIAVARAAIAYRDTPTATECELVYWPRLKRALAALEEPST